VWCENKFDCLTTFCIHKSTNRKINDAAHRLYQGVLDFQNFFKVSQYNYDYNFVYAPKLRHGFHCAKFQEKNNSSINLCGYLLYRILSNSNCVENTRNFPFKPLSELLLQLYQILKKLTITQHNYRKFSTLNFT
jgi:hypothetical protein